MTRSAPVTLNSGMNVTALLVIGSILWLGSLGLWRRFQSGTRRGCCPYELLGLRLPTTDWWQLLHTSLADSTQELSSSEVTI